MFHFPVTTEIQNIYNRQHGEALQWYQHRNQLRLGYDTGVWTAGEVNFLCVKQLGSECFPELLQSTERLSTIDRKISSPCTVAVNSAEQDSTMIVFWFSPSVKFFSVILSGLQLRASECYINVPIWGSP